MWGRSLPYSYKAQLYLKKGNIAKAHQYLETALTYAEKLGSPYETGIVYRIYAQIKAQEGSDGRLPDSLTYYCQKASACFQNVYSPGDLELLAAITP